jgi:hypothetical protein
MLLNNVLDQPSKRYSRVEGLCTQNWVVKYTETKKNVYWRKKEKKKKKLYSGCWACRHIKFVVPSPTHVNIPQYGGKVPTFEHQGPINNMVHTHSSDIFILHAKTFLGFSLNVGSSFLLDPTPDTSPKPHLQKVMPYRHPYHTWGWLRNGDLAWSGKSQLPCSRRLRLHRLTSSELGCRTWDPCVKWPFL